MAASDAHKRASYKYNAGRDNIMIRPTKETGQQIRQAAQTAGMSVQAYILDRIAGDGDAPAPAPQAPQYLTPEALDKACVDAVNEQPIIDNSLLGMQRFKKLGRDHLYTLHPDTRWEAGIDQGAKIGLGSAEYELVKMK